MRRGTRPDSVHQVAEQQPVPDADDEAGPEQERPILDRGERHADDAGIRARRALLLQADHAKHADQADRDEGALDQTGGDKAERKHLVLPLEDREQDDGAGDVRDDQEQLQRRSHEDAGVVGAGAGDVAGGVVEHGLEQIQRRDRRDEGDDEQHSGSKRDLSI